MKIINDITFSEHWPFGQFLCYAMTYFQGLSVLASSCTLVTISFERLGFTSTIFRIFQQIKRDFKLSEKHAWFDMIVLSWRYMSILHPLRNVNPRKNSTKWAIFGIWITSGMIGIPNVLLHDYVQIKDYYVCLAIPRELRDFFF